MEFNQIVAPVSDFFHDNMIISILGLASVAALLYESPKKTLKCLIILGALVGAVYFIGLYGKSSDLGVGAKEELTTKTKKALGE